MVLVWSGHMFSLYTLVMCIVMHAQCFNYIYMYIPNPLKVFHVCCTSLSLLYSLYWIFSFFLYYFPLPLELQLRLRVLRPYILRYIVQNKKPFIQNSCFTLSHIVFLGCGCRVEEDMESCERETSLSPLVTLWI